MACCVQNLSKRKFLVRLHCMERIRTLNDLDKLNQILLLAKKAADIAAFESEVKIYL